MNKKSRSNSAEEKAKIQMIAGRGIGMGNRTEGGKIYMAKGKGHVERKN